MRIKLFVDDSKDCPEGWMLARTITEAIRLLAQWEIDAISLDHDIKDLVKESFEPVARFLAMTELPCVAGKDNKNPGYKTSIRVWIHTGNPTGGEVMARILGLDYDMCRVSADTLNRFDKYYCETA